MSVKLHRQDRILHNKSNMLCLGCSNCHKNQCIDSSVTDSEIPTDPTESSFDFDDLCNDQDHTEKDFFDDSSSESLMSEEESDSTWMQSSNPISSGSSDEPTEESYIVTDENSENSEDSEEQSEETSNCLCEEDSSKTASTAVPSYNQTTSSGISDRGKKFTISFKSKTRHQWCEYNQGTQSIHINSKNGPVIHLYYNRIYFFCIEQDSDQESEHTFFLTTSPYGGPNSKAIYSGFDPIAKGSVCFKPDHNTPRYFFYQCTKHACEGGLVIVHEQS
jgi:hypothetical protein